MSIPQIALDAADLERFGAEAYARAGVPEEDARIAAGCLVRADLRGVHTHGNHLLPWYVARLRQGGLNPRPAMRVVRESDALLLLDADAAIGHLAATRAMERAIERARRMGVGAVGVRNANHLGAASMYAMMALEHGQIGLASSNTVSALPPSGGLTPSVGNNPLSVAVPAGRYPPIVLDMATSTVAGLKLILAARRGEKIPLGWALDKLGNPTDDPNAWLEGGTLTPFGGVKGYGLALVLEVLDAVLTGAGFGRDLPASENDFTQPERVGFFLLAVDVAAFLPLEQFTRRVDAFVEQLKGAKPAPGSAGVLLPGEIEHGLREARLRTGIPFEPRIVGELNHLADDLGIRRPKLAESTPSPPAPLPPSGRGERG